MINKWHSSSTEQNPILSRTVWLPQKPRSIFQRCRFTDGNNCWILSFCVCWCLFVWWPHAFQHIPGATPWTLGLGRSLRILCLESLRAVPCQPEAARVVIVPLPNDSEGYYSRGRNELGTGGARHGEMDGDHGIRLTEIPRTLKYKNQR